MTLKEYNEKRTGLMAKAKAHIDAGEIEQSNTIMQEVTDLDNKFQEESKAQANFNALNTVSNTGVGLTAGLVGAASAVMEGTSGAVNNANGADTAKAYEMAFGKYLLGNSLTDNDLAVINEFNPKFSNAAKASENTVLIPETVQKGIWAEIGEQHPIFGDMHPTFVNADLTIIKEDVDPCDAEWGDEDTEMSDSGVGFGEIKLTGCELDKCIPVKWALKEMAIPEFLAYITSTLATKMGNTLAKGYVTGKGKPGESDTFRPQPKGIVTELEAQSGTPQVKTYQDETGMTYDDIIGVFALIKSGYKKIVYANNYTIWNCIAKIKDTTGRPIFLADTVTDGVGRMFGAVVKEEDAIPDGAILVGDVAQGYVTNIKKNTTIMMEDHVKQKYTDYAAYAIVDGAVKSTKAFAYLKIEAGAVTPATATFDKNTSGANYGDKTFTVTNSTIKSLKLSSTTIAATNYTLSNSDKTVTIKKEYLSTLAVGDKTVNIITSTAADSCTVTITVVDTTT